MKCVLSIRLLAMAALSCLTVAAAQAQQPQGTRFSGPRYRTASAPRSVLSSRNVSSQTVSRSDNVMLEPETVATPVSIEKQTLPEADVAWEEGGEDSGGCNGECGGTCDSCSACNGCGIFGGGRRGLWYGSVDYLLVRPRFSQAVAGVRRVATNDTSVSPNVSTLTDTSVQFPYTYQSAFRASVGYKLLSCGGDVQFSYWRMTGDAQVNEGPANTIDTNPFIAGQLKNNPGNGQFLQASSNVTANIFDIDFAKCLAFGGPREPCDVCFCPRWDLRWFAGARIADITRTDNNATTDANGNVITTGNIDARFVGAGARGGVMGRRYFGPNGGLSVFAKLSQSLLIGDFTQSRVKQTTGDSEIATEVTSQYDKFSRMIPVSDIEVGGSWQIAPFTYISAGYFFQCWWDLGFGETIVGTNFGPLDTSNIMGWDGLFVRGEMLF